MNAFWIGISVGVLIVGMYAVVRMLRSLVTVFVDFGFALISQLFIGIEKDLNAARFGHSLCERSSTTQSHRMPISSTGHPAVPHL
jgi:hypothetical protein